MCDVFIYVLFKVISRLDFVLENCSVCISIVIAYTMDVNEAQEEYEEVQTELRKKDEEVGLLSIHTYWTMCCHNGIW